MKRIKCTLLLSVFLWIAFSSLPTHAATCIYEPSRCLWVPGHYEPVLVWVPQHMVVRRVWQPGRDNSCGMWRQGRLKFARLPMPGHYTKRFVWVPGRYISH